MKTCSNEKLLLKHTLSPNPSIYVCVCVWVCVKYIHERMNIIEYKEDLVTFKLFAME